MNTPNIECLKSFTDHRFAQLAVYNNGRTPLYLTEEQYNAIRELVAKAGTAPEQEPILIQAVAVTRSDSEEGLRLEWILEGGITELEHAGTVLFALPEANDLCDEDGSAYLYRRPDNEIEQLRALNTRLGNQRDAILLQARVWAGEAKTLQAITREVGEILGGEPNWGPIAAGVEALRQKLAAAHALLIDVTNTPEAAHYLPQAWHYRLMEIGLENIAEPAAPYADPRNGADTWSANGEDWHNIGTVAELIRESQSDLEPLAEGDVVFVGQIRYQDPASFVDRDAVLTSMNENAGASDAGEWVDGYPNSSQTSDQELTDLLEAWARKNCRPDFYLVDNPREYTITAADIEDALGAEVSNDE